MFPFGDGESRESVRRFSIVGVMEEMEILRGVLGFASRGCLTPGCVIYCARLGCVFEGGRE